MGPPGSTFRYKDIVLCPQLPPPQRAHLPPITNQDEAHCRQGRPGPTPASTPGTRPHNRLPASHTSFNGTGDGVIRPVGGHLQSPLPSSWASAGALVSSI